MPCIQTSTAKIFYKVKPLYLGVKRINKIKASNNLLLLKRLLDSEGISFGLIAGTLLGAVREQDFIEHDEDIDLFFLNEGKECVVNLLPRLLNEGFEVARYDRRGLLSIIRDGEYIDMYFFSLINENVRSCCGWCIPNIFLTDTTNIQFKGELFCVPKDYIKYLEYEYGDDWQIPIPWTDFKVPLWKKKIYELKEKVKYSLPQFVFDRLSIRAETKMMNKYKEKLSEFFQNNSF